jgi:SAM-dependent methyltransferase
LLEHLPRDRATPFLGECRRVLKPGGVLRIAAPDLEAIALLYLDALDAAWKGDEEAAEQHRWLVMELYDQSTREASGGSMLPYLGHEGCTLAWYRIGTDGAVIRKHLRSVPPPARQKLSWRERLIRWLLGDEYRLLEIGRFRRTAEVHHWMYDRVSLRNLLNDAGFINFRCVGPTESAIADWSDYHLDTTPDGGVCKPDSIFVEADKP